MSLEQGQSTESSKISSALTDLLILPSSAHRRSPTSSSSSSPSLSGLSTTSGSTKSTHSQCSSASWWNSDGDDCAAVKLYIRRGRQWHPVARGKVALELRDLVLYPCSCNKSMLEWSCSHRIDDGIPKSQSSPKLIIEDVAGKNSLMVANLSQCAIPQIFSKGFVISSWTPSLGRYVDEHVGRRTIPTYLVEYCSLSSTSEKDRLFFGQYISWLSRRCSQGLW